ncbi:hypothetical protein C5E10_13715 [Pseudoclavibacter sp. RFBG4]|uniref:YidH family protein n=1 Tax=Pseudoclavibacter sp. RFBG4 TaxID=2080575 RepID=UPI000CE85A23|nr:DUF202 domain-containing protein [Pseudoclavibacter sp. RFBG4]PPG28638.1 hypothetical protein C5E10_13715 [Pseudoclavibacter sp. RFBG4]
MTRQRWPHWVYREGDEPDPRFTLANERTFLAWIRTSLALVAAGVALEALALPIEPVVRLIAALLFLGLGLLAAVNSFIGWMRAERSMRRHEPLPGPSLSGVLSIGVVLAVALVTIGLLV